MADVLAHTSTFPRGSAVLDYWLVHAQGMTVEPLGGTVEGVVLPAPFAPPQALLVRKSNGREAVIPVEAVAAVQPAAGRLLLEPQPPRLPRPSPEHAARARAGARATLAGGRRASRAGYAGAAAALVWLRPRAVRAAVAAGRGIRIGCAYGLAASAWLAPRLGAAARRAAAVAVAGAHLVAVWAAARTDRSGDSPRTRPDRPRP